MIGALMWNNTERHPLACDTMGLGLRGRIGELLEQVDLGSQVVAVEPVMIPEDIAVPRRDSALSAWVNVIHGCNERCTYCVVPNTRGVEQSRAPDAIKVREFEYRPDVRSSAKLCGLRSLHIIIV